MTNPTDLLEASAWRIHSQKLTPGQGELAWETCCDVVLTGMNAVDALLDAAGRHGDQFDTHGRFLAHPVSDPNGPHALELRSNLFYVPGENEGQTLEELAARLAWHKDFGGSSAAAPEVLRGAPEGPENATADDSTAERTAKSDASQLLDDMREALHSAAPDATARLMMAEDQLKRAGAELEETLRGVMLAQRSLNRKGAWWCYSDSLVVVARAASVYTAAFLQWDLAS